MCKLPWHIIQQSRQKHRGNTLQFFIDMLCAFDENAELCAFNDVESVINNDYQDCINILKNAQICIKMLKYAQKCKVEQQNIIKRQSPSTIVGSKAIHKVR